MCQYVLLHWYRKIPVACTGGVIWIQIIFSPITYGRGAYRDDAFVDVFVFGPRVPPSREEYC